MTQFPMCEKYGLMPLELNRSCYVVSPKGEASRWVMEATAVEAFLSRGKVVLGHKNKDTELLQMWEQPAENDTHTALLIGITEIKKDSADDIVRGLAKLQPGYSATSFIERAKALVGSAAPPEDQTIEVEVNFEAGYEHAMSLNDRKKFGTGKWSIQARKLIGGEK